MKVDRLAERYPDMGKLVGVGGAAWAELMGWEWAAAHAEIPIFLDADDVSRLTALRGLEHRRLRAAMRRFLKKAKVRRDRDPEVLALRQLYGEILAGYQWGQMGWLRRVLRRLISTPRKRR